MKWIEFKCDGVTYDLSHLHPLEWHYTAKAGEKRPERTYKFHVVFSMHCFTRAPSNDKLIEEKLWYQGPKEKRIFCFDRHDLSFQLPYIVKSMGERVVWHTHHGNYFTIELTTKDGERVEYEMYFDITRASRRGWLNLVVQTAYIRTDAYQSLQPSKRKIAFDVIAYNTQVKKKIRPPR